MIVDKTKAFENLNTRATLAQQGGIKGTANVVEQHITINSDEAAKLLAANIKDITNVSSQLNELLNASKILNQAVETLNKPISNDKSLADLIPTILTTIDFKKLQPLLDNINDINNLAQNNDTLKQILPLQNILVKIADIKDVLVQLDAYKDEVVSVANVSSDITEVINYKSQLITLHSDLSQLLSIFNYLPQLLKINTFLLEINKIIPFLDTDEMSEEQRTFVQEQIKLFFLGLYNLSYKTEMLKVLVDNLDSIKAFEKVYDEIPLRLKDAETRVDTMKLELETKLTDTHSRLKKDLETSIYDFKLEHSKLENRLLNYMNDLERQNIELKNINYEYSKLNSQLRSDFKLLEKEHKTQLELHKTQLENFKLELLHMLNTSITTNDLNTKQKMLDLDHSINEFKLSKLKLEQDFCKFKENIHCFAKAALLDTYDKVHTKFDDIEKNILRKELDINNYKNELENRLKESDKTLTELAQHLSEIDKLNEEMKDDINYTIQSTDKNTKTIDVASLKAETNSKSISDLKDKLLEHITELGLYKNEIIEELKQVKEFIEASTTQLSTMTPATEVKKNN